MLRRGAGTRPEGVCTVNDLHDLYRDLIIDHSRSPQNTGRVENTEHVARGDNPICGDQFTISLALDEAGVITDIRIDGAGCAISTASASMMTVVLKGRTSEECDAIFHAFHNLVTADEAPTDLESLGRLAAFAGVRRFPIRVKCATLAWHAMRAAMDGGAKDVVTTEDGETP